MSGNVQPIQNKMKNLLILFVLSIGTMFAQKAEVFANVGLNFRENENKSTITTGVGIFTNHRLPLIDEITGSYSYTPFGIQGAHQLMFGVRNRDIVSIYLNDMCLKFLVLGELGNTHLTAAKWNVLGNAASFLRLPASNHFTGKAGVGLVLASQDHPGNEITLDWKYNKISNYPAYPSLSLGVAHLF